MNILSYFLKNSSIRLLVYGIGVASAFMVTPHIINSMGSATYGIWVLITSLVPYYNLTNLAPSNAISIFVAKTEDGESLQKIFISSIQLSLIAFIGTLLIASIYYFVAPQDYKNYISHAAFIISLFSFAASFGLYTILNTGHGMLAGKMHWNKLAFTGMSRVLISSICALVFLSAEYSPSENIIRMTCINAVGYLAEGGVNFALAFKGITFPSLHSFFKNPLHKELVHVGKGFFIIFFSNILRNSTQIYMISALLATSQIALYALITQLLRYVSDLLLSVFGIMTPYFSKLQTEESKHESQTTLLVSLFISFAFSNIIGLGLIFYGEPFFIRWIGPEFTNILDLLLPMSLATLIETGTLPSASLIYSLKKQHSLAKLSLFEGIAITLVSFPALYFYGLAGLGWTFFIVVACCKLIWLPLSICGFTEISLKKYYYNLFLSLVPITITQSVYYYYIKNYVIAEYGSIFLAGIGQTLIAVCTLFLLVKTKIYKV